MGRCIYASAIRSDAMKTTYTLSGEPLVPGTFRRKDSQSTVRCNTPQKKQSFNLLQKEGSPRPRYNVITQRAFVPYTSSKNLWSPRNACAIVPKADIDPPPKAAASIQTEPLGRMKHTFRDEDKHSAPGNETAARISGAPNLLRAADDPPSTIGKAQAPEDEPAVEAPCGVEDEPAVEAPCSGLEEEVAVPISPVKEHLYAGDYAQETCAAPASPCPSLQPRTLDEGTKENLSNRGLLRYRKLWFLREVDFSVNGEMLTGTPIFIKQGTLRVVNEHYSYIIPMKNVDYIRTPDGLRDSRETFDENTLCEM